MHNRGYPSEATSVEGFVSLVVQLVTHGYYFWVEGSVRNTRGLAPHEIDRRMVEKFDANLPKWKLPRRRKLGKAAVRYVRYGGRWYLFSTYGRSRFFDEHCASTPGQPHQFHDIRERSLRFHGYAIGLTRRGYAKKSRAECDCWQREKRAWQDARAVTKSTGESFEMLPRGRRHQRWVCRVAIQRERYLALRDELVGMATHRRADYLAKRIYNVPFEPYAPVRQQLASILREVNRARRHVGYEPVPHEAIRFHRRHVAAFRRRDEQPPKDF